jgi:hypothetical protein
MVEQKINSKIGYGHIDIVHRDQYGYVKYKHRQKIDSFIQQMWDKFYLFNLTVTTGDVTRVSGSAFPPTTTSHDWRAGSGLNGIRGILVGTGTNAVAYNNVNLQTRIEFGTSANQLSATATTVTYDDDTGEATLNRIFTNNNNTTDPIVGEVGIAFFEADSTSSMLGVRDLIDPTIQLFFNDTLEITYTLNFTGGNINWNMLFGKHWFARDDANIAFYNQSGSLVQGSYTPANKYPRFMADPYKDNGGITIGISNASDSAFNSVALVDKIYHGSGTNQLNYGGMQYNYMNTVNSNYTEYVFVRTFKNDSNANVTINEVGIESNVTIGGSDTNVLFARRTISPITIQPSQTKRISWAIRYDF